MARRSTGGVVEKETHRGTSYGIRFRALGRRRFVHVGYAADGCTPEQAAAELAFNLELIRRGEWQPPAEPEPEREVPTFHEFASEWLAERTPSLCATTVEAYRWELVDHLLPVFARKRLDAIDVAAIDAYRQQKLSDGRLCARSVNRTISRLGAILDVAHERGLIAQNPVRVNPRNRRAKVEKRQLPQLEPEQVVSLLDAAGELDREDSRGLPTRRPLLATLAWGGLRVREALELRWRAVDLAGGALRVERSKTEAGERTVDIQPELLDELTAWRAATPFSGPDDRVFPTASGTAQNRHNVRQRVVLQAVKRTNERRAHAGSAPLPDGLSPHALRRSFASWLLAEGEDVPYVQAQMGHTDPTMTLGAYARAVKSGRRSARSRRRIEAIQRASTGTSSLEALDGLHLAEAA